jgi:hypothetical protein
LNAAAQIIDGERIIQLGSEGRRNGAPARESGAGYLPDPLRHDGMKSSALNIL